MKELDITNDFGFSTVDPKEDKKRMAITERGKLLQVRDLIFPLLDNLMKDPHKDIRWPDRDKKLGELKSKIQTIVNGND